MIAGGHGEAPSRPRPLDADDGTCDRGVTQSESLPLTENDVRVDGCKRILVSHLIKLIAAMDSSSSCYLSPFLFNNF
jgi:hypothetical protein